MDVKTAVVERIKQVAQQVKKNSVIDFRALNALAVKLQEGEHTIADAKRLAYVVARWNNIEVKEWIPTLKGRKI